MNALATYHTTYSPSIAFPRCMFVFLLVEWLPRTVPSNHRHFRIYSRFRVAYRSNDDSCSPVLKKKLSSSFEGKWGNSPTYLHRIILGIFLGGPFEFLWFIAQLLRYGLFQGMIGIGRLHHAVHHLQAMNRVQCWTPASQDVHAHISRIQLDRGMVDLRSKFQEWCLEGILSGKLDVENELPSGVGRIRGALDLAVPFEHVLVDQANRVDVGERLFLEHSPFLQ